MENSIKKYKYDLAVMAVLFLVFFFFYLEKDKFGVFSSREGFQNFVDGFGAWGPLVVIASIVLEVVVAPIPGFVPAISAGFIFGPILGSIYTYLGNVLGTIIVFFLARKLGKPFVARFIKKERLDKYCKTIAKHQNYLLLFYFFPVLPVDVLTAAFGLSHIHRKKFFTIALAGLIFYSIVATVFGDYLAQVWFFG